MNTEKTVVPDKHLVVQSLLALWKAVRHDVDIVGVSSRQDDDDVSLAVRLQVLGTGWRLWEGDSSYDTDHRGHWGVSALPLREEPDFDDLAEDLLDQVEDSIAMQD